MPDAALGDEMPRIMFHIGGLASQDRDFHAAFVIEVNVQRREHQIVMLVPAIAEPLGKPAHLVVVDIGERGNALSRAAAVFAGAFQPARRGP